jgi:hypothetical protein
VNNLSHSVNHPTAKDKTQELFGNNKSKKLKKTGKNNLKSRTTSCLHISHLA